MTSYRKAADQRQSRRAQTVSGCCTKTVRVYSKIMGRLCGGIARPPTKVMPKQIGMLYANGQGVSRSLSQVRLWMEKAAARGYENARDWLASN
jgi:TPR repeat protein